MRIITEPASGDFQISVQDISETAATSPGYQQPQLGIVIRQSAALGAPFYTALQDPTYPGEGENVANVIMYYRDFWGGPVVELTQNYPLALPAISHGAAPRRHLPDAVQLQRHELHTHQRDGAHDRDADDASGRCRSCVGDTTATTTAVYQKLAVGPSTQTYVEQNETSRVPDGHGPARTSAPGSPIGDETLVNGVWTISGGGEGINLAADGIGNNRIADQFHYVYKPMTGDGVITGRLTSIANGSATAQAAMMMRADTSIGSPFYGVVVTPNLAATIEWRTNNLIQQRVTIPVGTLTLPTWFQINRYTDTTQSPAVTYYSLLTSTDGTNLDRGQRIHRRPQSRCASPGRDRRFTGRPAHAQQVDVGQRRHLHRQQQARRACARRATRARTSATVTSRAARSSAATARGPSPAGGPDMWDVYDFFHFVSQTLTGDGTVSAQVTSAGPVIIRR